jgi:prepilin-type processing-associated H-X9-DG protein
VDSYALNANLQDGLSGFKAAGAAIPGSVVLLFEVQGARADVADPDEGTSGFTMPPPSGFLSPAGDGRGAIPEYGYFGDGLSPLQYATGPIGRRTSILGQARHSGGANYAALDGHVKWLQPGQVSGGWVNPSPTGKQDQPPGAAAGTQAAYVMTFSPR